ncbi:MULTISPECIES: SusC/RagA family TonB-linked outer membrane protein [Niastella]|uniref:SusC/RagA family TonB-linked outer membrane protein n=1 Tax=Niastella soli TaxID=2821487 RepID=A0ABS3YU61_9BACT|nr:SusC/RagA family TonB-linked outer membrane protein [Niastella soli]MBO9201408.1 SusC/RagA family TonB-linked outer membrane protein [Niastella soli]
MQIIVCKLVSLLSAIGNKATKPGAVAGTTKMLRQAGRIMKLTAILILGACLQIHATGLGQGITLSERDVPIEKVLKKIQQQSDYKFLYTSQLLEGAPKVTVVVKNAPIQQVLDLVFKGDRLDYEVNEHMVIIRPRREESVKLATPSFTKDPIGEVRGVITDENGMPAQNVNVMVKGTSKGTTTNLRGEFVLRDVSENAVLLISSIGFDRQEIIVKNKDFLSVKLKIAVGNLDEAQVIAYGATSRRFTTGNVYTVKAADIEKQPVQNPLLALEGRVPGVVIIQTTGLSNGAVKIRIQGQNSIVDARNEPLIIIDGLPYPAILPQDRNGTPVSGGGPTGASPLSYLNPMDIESIDVLKDADATAIYGSRAANGAIIITTKSGKVGKAKIDINFQQGWGQITRKAKMMNRRQYLDMRYEALSNDGIDLNTIPSTSEYYDLKLWDTSRYTDWQKQLIGGTAQYTNISASVAGGVETIQYLIGAIYNRTTDVFPGDLDDQKGSVHFNVKGLSSNRRFTAQLSGMYMVDENKLPGVDLTQRAILIEPVAPALYKADGTLNWQPNSEGKSTWENPMVYSLYRNYTHNTRNLVSNALLSYTLLPGLEAKSSFGYFNMQTNSFVSTPIEFYPPESRPNSVRQAQHTYSTHSTWIIEPQVSYTRNFKNAQIETLVGATIQENNDESFEISGSGYPSNLVLGNILSAVSIDSRSNSNVLYKYNALFGRLNLKWNNKYLINLNARRDGSSRFGEKNRFHNFASVGIGWIFSNEKFIQKAIPFLSFGKLRGSYGTTGNDQIGDYSYLNLYFSSPAPIPYQGTANLSTFTLPNPYLQWEETKKWQVGIDLGFLNDRMILNFTYVLNRSSNQLLPYTLPTITGVSNILSNFPAIVQNTSLEFSLNTTNIKSKTWNWTSSFNLTIPQNKLISFPNIAESSYASGFDGVIVGQPLGIIKLFHYSGVDPATGEPHVIDVNGNATSTPDFDKDFYILRSPSPRYFGGIQNVIQYKGLELSFLFQFVHQLGKRALFYDNGMLAPGAFIRMLSNQPASALDRWRKSGDNNVMGKFTTDPLFSFPFYLASGSDAGYSYDASYIRLRNFFLSWRLPITWKQSSKIRDIQIYCQGQNLLTFTNYSGLDPENQNASALPPLRMLVAGLKIGL